MDAFVDLVRGRQVVPQWLRDLAGVDMPIYSPGVTGSYPSLYELMPRKGSGAYMEGEHAADDGEVDVFCVETWEEHGWGMLNEQVSDVLAMVLADHSSCCGAAGRREIARDHIRKCLENAEMFHRAMDCKLVAAAMPEGLKISVIAGEGKRTREKVCLESRWGRAMARTNLRGCHWSSGDGVVLRSSALGERIGLEWHQAVVLPASHARMTRVKRFAEVLREMLS